MCSAVFRRRCFWRTCTWSLARPSSRGTRSDTTEATEPPQSCAGRTSESATLGPVSLRVATKRQFPLPSWLFVLQLWAMGGLFFLQTFVAGLNHDSAGGVTNTALPQPTASHIVSLSVVLAVETRWWWWWSFRRRSSRRSGSPRCALAAARWAT